MRSLVAIFIVAFSLAASAQNSSNTAKVDRIALQIPDSLTRTATGIAKYVNASFTNESDKARGIFVWVTNSIRYDIKNMYAINFYQNINEIVDKVLKTRSGVCMHFAELYCKVANLAGVKSYVVTGYTKQNGAVDYTPHVWCASYIDSSWVLLDPTWGAGYAQNGKYVKKQNDFYFKTKPDQLVKSHMPFDPLWQFLNYPINHQEFYEGKASANAKKSFFSYSDTLLCYEKQSDIEKLVSANRRIERNGVKNSLTFDILQHNKREIEYYNSKFTVETYNSAIMLYNDGVNQLNRFIKYRNSQFTPKKKDEEIKQMVDDIETSLTSSKSKIKSIVNPDRNTANLMSQLNKAINDATVNLNEQKMFVDKYLKTGKLFRKSLFYKYTWMGVPVN